MGLDMYLTKRVFIGGEFEHRKVKGRGVDVTIGEGDDKQRVRIPAGKIGEVILPVAYWRKANQIHQWFVDECQDGQDECQETYVSENQLKELLELSKEVKRTGDSTQLPPQSGFFFGSTEVDERYWAGIDSTIDMLSEALKDAAEDGAEYSFYYQSSW